MCATSCLERATSCEEGDAVMARTLLLLGGSAQQVIAIQKAKECGYRTVVCDYLPDNPGQHHADAFYLVSTTDKDAVLEVARAEHADGVVAYASDPAAPTAAYVAEALGLPTNPRASVDILSTKTLFREHMRGIGLPCPQSVGIPADSSLAFAQEAVAALRFPIVVKPTDSSGSKGVTVLQSPDDVDRHLASALEFAKPFNRNGMLIAEEYIGGAVPHVVGGDIFVQDGRVRLWGFADCQRRPEHPTLPDMEVIPPNVAPWQLALIKKALQRLVESLGIRFGAMNIEAILDTDGTPYILELAARAGGNMLPVQLSDVSGIDVVRAVVMCAMGDDPGPLDWEPSNEYNLAYVLHSPVDGIYRGYTLSPQTERACYRRVIYQEPGAPVERFGNASGAMGILFFSFDDEPTLRDVAAHITDHVHVLVEK